MMTEMKPCPFCGWGATVRDVRGGHGEPNSYVPGCTNCSARLGGFSVFDLPNNDDGTRGGKGVWIKETLEQMAVDLWNTRA